MKIFLVSLILSLALHAFLFMGSNNSHTSHAQFPQGTGVVKVRLVQPVIKKSDSPEKKSQNNDENNFQGVITKAVAKGTIAPEYPYRSRLLREQGVVKARVSVSVEGEANKIEIVTSSGFNRLDQSVLTALEKSQFEAAKNGLGKKVEDSFELEFQFLLNKEESL